MQQQNKMSLVPPNIKPRTSAIHLSAATQTYFHPGLTDNMTQTNPNTQSTDHFQTEQALAHDHPFPDFPNIVIPEDFPPSTEALNDASIYKLFSLSNTVPVENPTTLQNNNMQESDMMHHNQIQPMNFEPSSIMIYENPTSIPHNSNFGINMNMDSSYDNNEGCQSFKG